MILSDHEIRAALERGAIRITPPPSNPSSWASTALDLALGTQLTFWDLPNKGSHTYFSPSDPDYDFFLLVERFSRSEAIPAEGFLIEPGTFCLGWTAERIQLPFRSRIAARVEGKSSLARLGIGVHVTALTIHAGFGYSEANPEFLGNPIQLEIWNAGPLRVLLKPGMTICQLIFEEVHGTPDKGYSGRFSVQGPR